MNGAVEKYAPVRAAPSPLKARTNSTRLIPNPNSPRVIADRIIFNSGSCSPIVTPIVQFTTPAKTPFEQAINNASAADTFRVRLLSIAQHSPASVIAKSPRGDDPSEAPGCHDSTTPPKTINTIPSTTRLFAFSLNTIHASKAVKTDSRLSIREATAPETVAKPYTRPKGPTIPPKNIAPNNQRHSRC